MTSTVEILGIPLGQLTPDHHVPLFPCHAPGGPLFHADQMGYRWAGFSLLLSQAFTCFAASPVPYALAAAQSAPLSCRDKAWSVNRLGRIARLHHQPEACVQIINTLYGFNAMEVQEAFVKVH